ncbi:hypothetical protein T265_03955 [Opisthorchis viverrini]|uniref:Uncharacterized protein n=1 Tax=Opisthorchis viverrini TaxID=6198 RepID=A0A074ZQI0_OPIVI|nr:hypothetical protein T265_03955 [Opisthorchis viverrini]KER29381.1 hypothetical protein T265_03955 [Opisthorchis viverrini]
MPGLGWNHEASDLGKLAVSQPSWFLKVARQLATERVLQPNGFWGRDGSMVIDWKVRGSKPTSTSRLPLSRLGQPDPSPLAFFWWHGRKSESWWVTGSILAKHNSSKKWYCVCISSPPPLPCCWVFSQRLCLRTLIVHLTMCGCPDSTLAHVQPYLRLTVNSCHVSRRVVPLARSLHSLHTAGRLGEKRLLLTPPFFIFHILLPST